MKITNQSIDVYLASLPEMRRKEIEVIIKMMMEITHEEPLLWGSIIGCGNVHYRYKSGTEGDMPLIGVASRSAGIPIYIGTNVAGYPDVKHLGAIQLGKGCIYIKKLSEINLDVLANILSQAVKDTLCLDYITRN